MRSLRLHRFAIWRDQDRSHEAQAAIALRNSVTLHATDIVAARFFGAISLLTRYTLHRQGNEQLCRLWGCVVSVGM